MTPSYLRRWRAAACLAALLGAGALANTARAVPPAPATAEVPAVTSPTIGMGDVQSGALLFRTPTPGAYTRAPALSTDIDIDVTGPILRATVTQTFRNEGSRVGRRQSMPFPCRTTRRWTG